MKKSNEKEPWLDFDVIKAEADVGIILVHYNLLDNIMLQGDAYVGHCPLGTKKHGKGDSFNFNLKKKTFKCFACKQHGSVLDFVAKYQGLHLRESAEVILEIMTGEGEKTNKPAVDLDELEENNDSPSTDTTSEIIVGTPYKTGGDDRKEEIQKLKQNAIDIENTPGISLPIYSFETAVRQITSGEKTADQFIIFDKDFFEQLFYKNYS